MSQRPDYRPDINGLRAIAVLSVVAFHASHHLLGGGFAGVDVFFVISGFLITRLILTDLEAGTFTFAGFYLRRIKRIFPALLLVMASTWLAGTLLLDPPDLESLGLDLRDGALFMANFRQMQEGGYFDGHAALKPLLHLWSLSLEEQYYIVCPAILVLAFRTRLWLMPLILAIIIASLVAQLWQIELHPVAAFYLPWGRAWELALGAALAKASLRGWVNRVLDAPLRQNIANLLGLGAIAWSMLALDENMAFPGWYALVPTLGTVLVLATPSGIASKTLLQSRFMVFIGLISYPLYLWHWPLLALGRNFRPSGLSIPETAALMELAVALATATWWWLERTVAAGFQHRQWRVASGLVTVMLATLALGQWTSAEQGFLGRYRQEIQNAFMYPRFDMANLYRGGTCFEYDYLQRDFAKTQAMFEANHCSVVADPGKPTVLLIGESYSAHLYAGLAGQLGDSVNLLQLNIVRCLPGIEVNVTLSPRCAAANRYIFERIRAVKPDVLMVSANYFAYVSDPHFTTANYIDWLVDDMHKLHVEGLPHILIVGQVPAWEQPLPLLVARELAMHRYAGADQIAEFTTRGLVPESLELDREMAARNWGPGITYLSLAAQLCTAKGCRQRVGAAIPEELISADRGHFPAAASRYVARHILVPAIRLEIGREARLP